MFLTYQIELNNFIGVILVCKSWQANCCITVQCYQRLISWIKCRSLWSNCCMAA